MNSKVHDMGAGRGRGTKNTIMQTPQRFCMPFLLLLLLSLLLHTTGRAGQTPGPQRRLFVQPNNYNTKREDERTGDRTPGQTFTSPTLMLLWFADVCPCFLSREDGGSAGITAARQERELYRNEHRYGKETSVSTSWLVLRRLPHIADLSPPPNHRKTAATTVTSP